MRASSSTSRSRSLSGCETCRRRHTKCDERRPSCMACEKHGVACEGYEIRLVFDASDDVNLRCRRPLFTVETRQEMSEVLTASVDPNSVDWFLAQVDESCDRLNEEDCSNFMTERGPFGAFRISDVNSAISSVLQSPVLLSSQEFPSDSPADVVTTDNMGCFSDDPLMECLLWDFGLSFGNQHDGFFNTDPSPLPYFDEINMSLVPRAVTAVDSISSLVSPSLPTLAPDRTTFLLTLYRQRVVRFFSPVSCQKTPWQILHVPIAMETFAQLTMGEFAVPARMCIFYSILAVAAFALPQLVSEECHQTWRIQGEAFIAQAQAHLTMALRDSSSPSKRVKYKDMLIAFLCMATAWAYQGNERRIECCFLDCEQWILSRGVIKPKKSRKVRLLHHCYLCSRVFYESTSVCRKPVFPANNPSARFFRRQQWADRFEQRMNEQKECTVAENDMHFDVPGRWDSSMYPEIYGIPEPLLVSIAHITRLANEKELSSTSRDEHCLDLKEFFRRARSLEKYICAWQPPVYKSEGPTGQDGLSQQQHDLIINNMIIAMHKALLIFFYRRIYGTDPTILQEYVRQVRKLLVQCDQWDVAAVHLSTSFVWITFIASCEAIDPDSQVWFGDWFDAAARKSNVEVFHIAKRTAQEVWRRRKAGVDTSWPTVLQETRQNLFYL
ncbi:uncharacterized protein N7459_000911 [Penicillium hispanicum]|uniref:uncharacterized protein n=1 Tax=Penicillium hispanicum TaxID=1080232 RepID=UPI002540EFD1|nr:uncharacterized protein N7459_000911 [Penicillium hispanicum]KAJ5594703.1 hypothetical protein N7459_000911 [Penicillium hispanicum]